MATDYPLTMAIRALREAKVEFSAHLYDYEEKGGTAASSKALGVSEHGTSPFGTKRKMPIYIEPSVLLCEKIFINGGKRGFLIGIKPSELDRVLNPTPISMKQA